MIPMLTGIASIPTTESIEYPVSAITFWVIVGAGALIIVILIKEFTK